MPRISQRTKTIRTGLVVALLTSAGCVLVIEVVLAYLDATAHVRRAARAGVEFDRRSKIEVLDDLIAAGVRAAPAVYGRDLLETYLRSPEEYPVRIDGESVLPLAGVSEATTVFCNESGSYVLYRSDEHGFHNPPGSWSTDPRIVAVGDSFTQGTCVPTESNLVAHIRAERPGTLNLGIGGNGPLLELATIKEYLPALEPEIVLWFYYEGNDLQPELETELRHPILRRYLDEPGFRQDLLLRQAEIDRALEGWIERERRAEAARAGTLLRLLVRVAKLTHIRSRFGLALGGGTPDLPAFRRVLQEARRTVEGWGGELWFVYLPEKARYRGSGIRAGSPPRESVLDLVSELELPLVDIQAAFEEAGAANRFYDVGLHYNEAGYELVGRRVLRALEERGR